MSLSAPRLRTLLLGLTMLVGLQVCLGLWAFWQSVHDEERGLQFPLPSRLVAMAEAVEATPRSSRDVLLRALETPDVSVELRRGDWLGMPGDPRVRLPRVEAALAGRVEGLGDRKVRAWLAPPNGQPPRAARFERLKLWSPDPLRVAVSLSDGEWLVVESAGDHAEALLGTPAGFWAGLFGSVAAGLALMTLWRGLAPLEGLSGAVDAFSRAPVARTVAPRGPKETRRIIAAFNRMQARIGELLDDRRIMFAALSHDLRTYLTRLTLRVDAIADPEERGRAERDLAAMSAIIEDALLLAKLDTASDEGTLRVEAGDLLREVAANVDLPSDAVRIEDLPFGTTVRGDGLSLLRAIQNLVENAKRHAVECEVEIGPTDGVLRVEVLDRGAGVPSVERDRVLRPFERGDAARSLRVPGSGLGLAIAARAADQAGGGLALLDRPGGGLIARLDLPMHERIETIAS